MIAENSLGARHVALNRAMENFLKRRICITFSSASHKRAREGREID
jgi:hypothetical protein